MRRLCLTVLLFLGIVACDDAYESSIPDISFYFTCSLVQADYIIIQSYGQFKKVTRNANLIPVGYAGLLIGRFNDFGNYRYIAYDAACPVEASRSTSLDLSADFRTGICPVCKTKYDLENGGFPVEGKGTEALKRYNVMVSGDNLEVRN